MTIYHPSMSPMLRKKNKSSLSESNPLKFQTCMCVPSRRSRAPSLSMVLRSTYDKPELSDEQHHQLVELLEKYKDRFTMDMGDLEVTSVLEHEVNVKFAPLCPLKIK